jgi:antitoxin (DNA-binding transcriptional repressor) of toxin-antitoxin stability system
MTTLRDSVPDLNIPPGTDEIEMPASLFRKQFHRLLVAVEERPALRVTITVSGRPVAELRQSKRDSLHPADLIFQKSQEKSLDKSAEARPPARNAIRLPSTKR